MSEAEVGREDTRLGRDGPDGDGVGGDSRSRSAARLRAGRPGGGHYQGVARNADAIRAVAPIAFNPCLDLRPIRCSTLLCTSPRGCRSLYLYVVTGSLHPRRSERPSSRLQITFSFCRLMPARTALPMAGVLLQRQGSSEPPPITPVDRSAHSSTSRIRTPATRGTGFSAFSVSRLSGRGHDPSPIRRPAPALSRGESPVAEKAVTEKASPEEAIDSRPIEVIRILSLSSTSP